MIHVLGNVDLTNLRKAPPLLMKMIIDNYQILYQKNDQVFDNFEVYTLHRYVEAKPIFQMHNIAIKRFIQEK